MVENEEGGTPTAPTATPFGKRLKKLLLEHLLIVLLVAALINGIVLGFLLRLRPEPPTKRELLNLRFPGEILMNMLKIMILPLITSSLIAGMTSLNLNSTGKLGTRAFLYYLVTTLLAVILGIILVLIIRPGEGGNRPTQGNAEVKEALFTDTLIDLLRQVFPNNMIEVTFQKTLTRLRNDTVAGGGSVMNPYLTTVKGTNMLGVISLSLATSIAINVMGLKGELLKAFFVAVLDLSMVMITWVIWYSPIGIFFLIAKEIVGMKDPQQMFLDLGYYFITVLLGLVMHGFLLLPALYMLVIRKNPYKFMEGVVQCMVTAFGTASSLATLPVTMDNLEKNNKVDPRVVGFVAPVGATINMDGTALYEAVAVIFIAQVEGVYLSLADVIVICFTATVAAIGAAGVPQAGLVTMVIVLAATGLPADKIGFILSVDWLLDRFRTAINVWGDCVGCAVVQHLCKDDLLHSTLSTAGLTFPKSGSTNGAAVSPMHPYVSQEQPAASGDGTQPQPQPATPLHPLAASASAGNVYVSVSDTAPGADAGAPAPGNTDTDTVQAASPSVDA